MENIISQSLEYYDKCVVNNKPLVNSIKYIQLKQKDEYNIIVFYDKNKNIIKESKYEILGIFNSSGNIWTWGWSIATLNKNLVSISKKIFNYGFDLFKTSLNLKNQLITSRFKISNPIQLEIHVAIGSYLSKQQFIFNYKAYDNEYTVKNTIYHNGNSLYNIKKQYDDKLYNEYFLIIID
jgi:hypothetical protein